MREQRGENARIKGEKVRRKRRDGRRKGERMGQEREGGVKKKGRI